MPGVAVVLGVAALAAVVIAIAVAQVRKERDRVASIFALTASKGWQFDPGDPYDLPDRWSGAPFGKGFARRARNVVTGDVHGHPMVAFDYSYKERSSNGRSSSTTTYHYAICALTLPCPLPALHVEPEALLGRIGTMLGMQDVELESEDFNRRYRVRCPDPKLASDVLTPRTMELLMEAGTVHFRFAGGEVVAYDRGLQTPADLLNRTAVLARVVEGIPSFVWADRGVTLPEATT